MSTGEWSSEKARSLRADILANAAQLDCISSNNDPDCPPPWFEPKSFARAQKLFKTYQTVLGYNHVIGLILSLYFSEILQPLLKTGKSECVSKLFVRYLNTMLHVFDWFEYDPFDSESRCYKSLKSVRAMHRSIADKMNDGRNFNDGERRWVSQLDMHRTQFSFMGLMAIRPKEFGFHKFKSKDFHALFHFWRVIGYCLGIDDRFNLCSWTDEVIIEMCHQSFAEDWRPVLLKRQTTVGVEMGKGISLAFQELDYMHDYHALMRYTAKVLDLDVDQFPLETRMQRLKYWYWNLVWKHVTAINPLNRTARGVCRLVVRKADQNRIKFVKKLDSKYPELHYTEEQLCPFAHC